MFIRVAGHAAEFVCAPDASVLDAALDAGFDLPYSCRNGVCASCRGRIVEGEVAGGEGVGVLTDAERGNGEVLLCQAKPLSDVTIAVREFRRRDPDAIKHITAKVFRMQNPAPDVTILQLRFPAGTRARFKAGQYLRVELGDGAFRYFSMANAPQQNDGVELHVRHVPGGRFSAMLGTLEVGQALDFSLPYGDFFLRESDRPVVLLASGTGFAPIKSLVEDAAKRGLKRDMTLYWGARRQTDLYLADLPVKWALRHPWLRFVPVLSDPAPADDWSGRTGYVHQAVLDDFASLAAHEVYACGAPAMITAARQSFTEQRQLARDAFYCDAFVPTV